MKAVIFALAAIVFAALSPAAQAALIEVVMSGSTDTAEGSIDYAPGGVFSARFVFDTDLASPDSTSPGVGLFQEIGDMPGGNSGLLSAEITTPLGMVGFERSLIVPADELQLGSAQIQTDNRQDFATSVVDLGLGLGNADESAALFGSLGTGEPVSFNLNLISSGPGATFFNDPFSLLSGQPGLSLADFFAATIIIVFADGSDAELAIGMNDFFDIRLLDDSIPSEVPIPGALVLMLSGLAGLGFAGRKAKRQA